MATVLLEEAISFIFEVGCARFSRCVHKIACLVLSKILCIKFETIEISEIVEKLFQDLGVDDGHRLGRLCDVNNIIRIT